MLVIAVGFMLLTSTIFWLLSTILFPIGANVQQFICKPLYDDSNNFTAIRKVMNELPLNISGFLARLNPNATSEDSSDFDTITILLDCKNNTAAFTALKLDKFMDIDKTLQTVQDQLKDLGKMDVLKNVALDPSKLFPSSRTNLNTVLNQAGSKFDMDLTREAITRNLNILPQVNGIIEALKEVHFDSMLYNKTKTTFEEMAPAIGDALEKWNDFEELNVSKITFENLARTLDGIEKKLTADKLNDEVLPLAVGNYSARLFGHVVNYINFASNAVKHEIGGCKPVWNLFESVRNLACREILDPLNGFWFALGWCLFFFLPLSIVSCKLSKHFRRLHHRSNRIYGSWESDQFIKGTKF